MSLDKRKLHLACGHNILTGWENFDIKPRSELVKFIDLLEPFPLEDASVDFIFLEHAIEHFDEVDGYKIMQEIYRVLKPGGVFRCSTPSLDTYVQRYINWNESFNERHRNLFGTRTRFLNFAFLAEASTTSTIKYIDGKHSTNDGHKFIYSSEDLLKKISDIGFTQIASSPLGKSEFQELCNIDYRGRHGYPDNLDLIIDARK